jgi:signal-transduction protein with cAMP-binding, CBS, and nucleotidyltransferase domain
VKSDQASARIDPYPYQHRVSDVMRKDAPILDQSATLAQAVREMASARCSAVMVADAAGRIQGIVTERDAIDCWAKEGGGASARKLGEIMSTPVASVGENAFIYVAIARMNRLSIRHLPVLDPVSGKVLGLLEIRALLRWRIGASLGIGDEITAAADGHELGAIVKRLPEIAASLRRESVPPSRVAAIISGVFADATARASELAAQKLAQGPWGSAPAPWCMLILGSAGRGESLLAADQDNALIHAGADDDHVWFAELGQLASTTLNEAGVPFCRGGVMAMNRELRHNRKGWYERIQAWLSDPEPVALRNADIFYDFVGVAGDLRLAQDLRVESMRAQGARQFLALMAAEIRNHSAALDWFGRFRQKEGRVDLKIGGLFPIVAGGRVLALKLGVSALSTQERWRRALEADLILEEDFARLIDAHEMILGLILEQQLADLAEGRAASALVAVKRLLDLDKDRLREALHIVGQVDMIVHNALQGVR